MAPRLVPREPAPAIREPGHCSSTSLTSGDCRSSRRAPKEKKCSKPKQPRVLAFRKARHRRTRASRLQTEISTRPETKSLFGCCARHAPIVLAWQDPSPPHVQRELPAPRPSPCGSMLRMWRRKPTSRLRGCFLRGSTAPASLHPRLQCARTALRGGQGRRPPSPSHDSTLLEPCPSSRATAGPRTCDDMRQALGPATLHQNAACPYIKIFSGLRQLEDTGRLRTSSCWLLECHA